jgi:hypothetical protein
MVSWSHKSCSTAKNVIVHCWKKPVKNASILHQELGMTSYISVATVLNNTVIQTMLLHQTKKGDVSTTSPYGKFTTLYLD